jgi:hypothetical protein
MQAMGSKRTGALRERTWVSGKYKSVSKSAKTCDGSWKKPHCGNGGHLGISVDFSSSGLSNDTKKPAALKNCSDSKFDGKATE